MDGIEWFGPKKLQKRLSDNSAFSPSLKFFPQPLVGAMGEIVK
jgi:hypothetical protein